jgi:hypothetical protein
MLITEMKTHQMYMQQKNKESFESFLKEIEN